MQQPDTVGLTGSVLMGQCGNTVGGNLFENTALFTPSWVVPHHPMAQIDPAGLTLPPTTSKQPDKLHQLAQHPWQLPDKAFGKK